MVLYTSFQAHMNKKYPFPCDFFFLLFGSSLFHRFSIYIYIYIPVPLQTPFFTPPLPHPSTPLSFSKSRNCDALPWIACTMPSCVHSPSICPTHSIGPILSARSVPPIINSYSILDTCMKRKRARKISGRTMKEEKNSLIGI